MPPPLQLWNRMLLACVACVVPALGAIGLEACSFPEYEVQGVDPLALLCVDEKPSSAESDIDCGGGCPPCGMGQRCREPADCNSLSCIEGICQMPTCSDGVKNASEADVDCAGRCAACAPGRDCADDADCAEGVCADAFCQRAACDDGVRNGDETATDCGGSCPSACEIGQGCDGDLECASGHCSDHECVAPGCTDALLNGNESDLDCGGNECGPCQAGGRCTAPADCRSDICEQGRCTAFSCDDGALNGEETAIDCGGTNCEGCADLQRCLLGDDCASGLCLKGLCVPSQPTGEPLSREGWFAGASHTYPDHHPDMVLDSSGGRWTSGAPQVDGMTFEVDMGELRTFFEIVIRADEALDDYPRQYHVYLGTDRNYGEPALPLRPGTPGTVTIEFDTAQLARHFKIVLRRSDTKWWSINEINVLK